MLSSYVRLLDPTVNCCLPKSRILWLRTFLLISPTPCRSLSVDSECSALVLGGRIIAVVSPWQGWSLWSAEPCQSAGVAWCGAVRCGGGDELCRKETGFSRWQDYDDQLNCHRPGPATALVRQAKLSLPYLCLSAMPFLTHLPSLDSSPALCLSVSFPHFLCLPTPSFCIQFLTPLLTRILWGYFVSMTMYYYRIHIPLSGLGSNLNWIRNAF